MGIHKAVLDYVNAGLETALITNVPKGDNALTGLIIVGPLQGEPLDVDEARISVELHVNDPDAFIPGSVSSMKDAWNDDVAYSEVGGSTTFIRRFSIKARCLLVDTAETLLETQEIASKLRDRMELALLSMTFQGVVSDDGNEYVSRGCVADELAGEMYQGGGPPDAYEYRIKVRFSVLTTRMGV